jgi:hypothetical protein
MRYWFKQFAVWSLDITSAELGIAGVKENLLKPGKKARFSLVYQQICNEDFENLQRIPNETFSV